jgi:hypothetical protein
MTAATAAVTLARVHVVAVLCTRRLHSSYVLSYILKYLSPVGSMIKFWVTTFSFMKVA